MRRLPSLILSLTLCANSYAAQTPPRPALEKLATDALIATIKPHLAKGPQTATDYHELAQAYRLFGEQMEQAGMEIPDSVIEDGLTAVDEGEKLNPKTGKWSELRDALNGYGKKKRKKNEPQQDQQKQDQQNKDQQKQDQKQDKSDPSSSQKNQSKSDQSQDQKQDQQSDPSQQPSENSSSSKDPNSAQPPKDPAQNQQPQEAAFGDMKQPEKPADAQQSAQPSDQPPEQPEMQQVGGAPQNGSTQPTDPNLIGPLQKLDEIRQKDSPAQLQQLLQGPAKPQPPGKNW